MYSTSDQNQQYENIDLYWEIKQQPKTTKKTETQTRVNDRDNVRVFKGSKGNHHIEKESAYILMSQTEWWKTKRKRKTRRRRRRKRKSHDERCFDTR